MIAYVSAVAVGWLVFNLIISVGLLWVNAKG